MRDNGSYARADEPNDYIIQATVDVKHCIFSTYGYEDPARRPYLDHISTELGT
jgi:hypothetical protein